MQGECPYDYLLDMALIREFPYWAPYTFYVGPVKVHL